MDATTTPTGEWAPVYAERLHFIAGLDALNYEDPSPAEAAAMAGWGAPFGEPEPTDAVTEDRLIPGPHGDVPVRIYRPADGVASGVGLVWIHGGAFVGGDLDMPEADLVARGLVTRTRGVVVSVDYRLCRGGVHHPVPHEDCWAAFTWTRAHASELGIDPGRLGVGGASAGGNLAASVALHGRDVGTPPAQALLLYPVLHPWLRPSAELAACIAKMPGCLTFLNATDWINTNYLGGPVSSATPYAFAGVCDDLAGFPATYIEACEFDDLRATGEEFATQLDAAGVDVERVTAAGVPHGHLNAVGSPLTHATLDRLAARLLSR